MVWVFIYHTQERKFFAAAVHINFLLKFGLNFVQEQWAQSIESGWPDGSRMSILVYATIYQILFTLEDELTKEEYAEQIRNLETIGGATFTKYAFAAGFDQVWAPTLNEPNRDRYTIFITDGEASSGQSACNFLLYLLRL